MKIAVIRAILMTLAITKPKRMICYNLQKVVKAQAYKTCKNIVSATTKKNTKICKLQLSRPATFVTGTRQETGHVVIEFSCHLI